MNNHRPKNLNLLTIQFPIPAIASILHRLSGLVLFLCIPLFLWLFNHSLSSEEGFEYIASTFSGSLVKCIVWCIMAAFIYHLMAGIRHLLMDVHVGDTLKGGRLSALFVFMITFILMIGLGIWLW